MAPDVVHPFFKLGSSSPDPAAIRLLPETVARRYLVVPLWVEGNELVIACATPSDRRSLREISRSCRHPVRPLRATYAEIRYALDLYYRGEIRQPRFPDLAEVLYLLGHLDQEGLERVRTSQAKPDKSIAKTCRDLGLVQGDELAEAVGLLSYQPHIYLEEINPSLDFSILIPWKIARDRKVLPLWWVNGILMIGVSEGSDEKDHFEDIANLIGAPIQPVICSRDNWDRLYRYLYLHGRLEDGLDDLPVLRWLVEHDKITQLNYETAKAIHKQSERPLEVVLVENGVVSNNDWLQAKSRTLGVPLERQPKQGLWSHALPPEVVQRIPESIATYFGVLPLRIESSNLVLGVSNPDPRILKLIERLSGFKVSARLLDPPEINQGIKHLYAKVRRPKIQPTPKLGELLLALGILTQDQLKEVLAQYPTRPGLIGEQLVMSGYLGEIELCEALSLQNGIPYIRLDYFRFEQGFIAEIPVDLALDHQFIPLWSNEKEMWLAVADPFDVLGLAEVEKITGKRIWPVLAPKPMITAALERLVGRAGTGKYDAQVLSLLKKLTETGFLTQLEATHALQIYTEAQVPLDSAIVQASERSQAQVAQALANHNRLPLINLQIEEKTVQRIDPLGQMVERTIAQDPVDPEAAKLLDLQTALSLSAIPVKIQGNNLQVAFADPLFQQAREKLESLLGRQITPVAAIRKDLEDSIQRNLGRRNIGTYLLIEGLITRNKLNDALDYARKTGVRLGQALVNRGYITWDQLYQFLAQQTSLPFYNLRETKIDEVVVRLMDPTIAHKYGILPIWGDEKNVTLAITDPLDGEALEIAGKVLKRKITPVLVTETDLGETLERIFRRDFLVRSVSELLERFPDDSAYRVLSLGQTIAIIIFLVLSGIWIFFDHLSYIIVLNALSTAFYLSFSAYKFYLIYKALSHSLEVDVTPGDIHQLNEQDLPVYTILVPIYREADVLAVLLNALDELDYPKTKLDIKILMEEDDQETIDAFYDWNPSSHFHAVIVPQGQPKTKPKACNYGLIHAKGEYIVIYDAEDLPEPDQLKKIMAAFSKVRKEVVCIQSKLNYFNSHQNLLTRWFTVEYSMWFDLFLPGLDASGAPIPLGGTSNHFRTSALIEVGGWDPFNVTEDADLGVRLNKRGYKTAIIDSTTFEEANSRVYNWIRQRSRWVKGYIQTWLVHMRHPIRLMREMGFKGFVGFQFVVGGTFFAALLNPIYWLLTTLWFWRQLPIIQIIFPGPVYFLGAVCLFLGNFAFTYMNVAGAMRRGYYDMVKYALLSPLYWGMTSVAAWRGFLQLFFQPHFWEKTIHGLYETAPGEENGNRSDGS